jgi:hypothetical protein
MTELNFAELSTVTGGAVGPQGLEGQFDWWALDDLNREKIEEIMRRSRSSEVPVY